MSAVSESAAQAAGDAVGTARSIYDSACAAARTLSVINDWPCRPRILLGSLMSHADLLALSAASGAELRQVVHAYPDGRRVVFASVEWTEAGVEIEAGGSRAARTEDAGLRVFAFSSYERCREVPQSETAAQPAPAGGAE